MAEMIEPCDIADEDWCFEQMENLKNKENRLVALNQIRIRLNETPNLGPAVANRLLTCSEIYECVDDNTENTHQEQSQLAINILTICMSNLTINNNELPQVLERVLAHNQPQIRAQALHTILKELVQESKSTEKRIVLNANMIKVILESLQHEETQVGVPCIGILSLVLDEILVEQPCVREMLIKMLSQNETIKCRVYELGVNLAKRSSSLMEKVEFLLDAAVFQLSTDDILVQVNILEILVSLTEQNHGLVYLERREVFEALSKRIEFIDQQPMDQVLVPGIMKFFGKIGRVQPQKIIPGYPHLIYCLFECIHSSDTSILPTVFDTLANLAATQQGIYLLDKHYAVHMKEILELYATYLKNLSTDLKIRAFNTLEVIFYTDDICTPQASDIQHKWYNQLVGESGMQFLFEFCRNPFPDIKVACLQLIKALCLHDWGMRALKNTNGFVDYLLDRKDEFDKEAKFAKFEVIKQLADSSVFDVQTHILMRRYITEGPYHVESLMDIATEGN